MATTNDLKNGMTLDIEGQLWTVVEFQHVKPGKGPAFVRTKLKQVMTGKVVDKTFNAGVKVEIAVLEKREMNFLYKEGDDFVFMDNENFEQVTLNKEMVEGADLMKEGQSVEILINAETEQPISCEMPLFVELVVTYTEPGIKGDTANSPKKPATVETGATITVPLFIQNDEKIKVDTRTYEYVERVK